MSHYKQKSKYENEKANGNVDNSSNKQFKTMSVINLFENEKFNF